MIQLWIQHDWSYIFSITVKGVNVMTKKDTKGRNLKPKESQMADGRYRYRYTDLFGKSHAIYSWKLVPTDKIPAGKRDDLSLREKVKALEKDLSDGISTSYSNMTVNQLIQLYLDTKTRLAISTKENYIHIWEKNIKSNILGSLSISKVKKSDILKYYAYLYEERNFSIKTIQLYQNLLYPAFQLAVDDSFIRLNPCKNCMKEYVRGSLSSDKKPLSVTEQNILLNFLKSNNFYSNYYVLVMIMLGTGCRIGETLGLTWHDINFKEKCIDINHQLIYKKKDGRIQYYSAPPKTRRSRIIPVQDNILEILKKLKEETYFISKSSEFKIDGYDEFIFLNREDKVYTPNTISRAFRGMRDAYNKEETENAYFENRKPVLLPSFSPHTLRHTYCTRMAENGMDIRVLQEIMGHANISVTMQVYNHVNVERSKKEVAKIATVLEA